MKHKLILAALALAIPGMAHAAEKPAPSKDCCCKEGEDGKMACCEVKGDMRDEAGLEGQNLQRKDGRYEWRQVPVPGPNKSNIPKVRRVWVPDQSTPTRKSEEGCCCKPK